MPLANSKLEIPLVGGAMALIAGALGLGLVLQAGIDPFLGMLVASAALLVMLSAYLSLRRTRKYAAAIETVTGLAQRLSALEDRVGAIDEKIGQAHALPDQFVNLDSRLNGLRAEFEQESALQRERVSSELQVIEALVKQLAEEVAVATAVQSVKAAREFAAPQAPADDTQVVAPNDMAAPAPVASSFDAPEPQAPQEPQPPQEFASEPGAFVPQPEPQVPQELALEPDAYVPQPDAPVAQPAVHTAPVIESGDLLHTIRRSIEANRIDLYLQPIVSLPDRKVLYYEALTRLRDEQGGAILPADYIQVAEPAGLMPLIDNMLLFRAVQVMRRFAERNRARSLFCNFSILSLLDSEFFPEFMNFLEQHTELTDSLFFEFGQPVVEELGPIELESLSALGELGFRFSLDKVVDLDLDFQALYQHHFRYLKIDSDIFLNGMAEAGAQIHAADMRDYLHRFGLDLIVEKVETEATATALIEHDVRLAQGYLFSQPKPVRAEIFDHDTEGAAA